MRTELKESNAKSETTVVKLISKIEKLEGVISEMEENKSFVSIYFLMFF